MNRDKLISQVKNEYARLSSSENGSHFEQSTASVSPDAYYENLLQQVIKDISAGRFDGFRSGREIVEAVANDKSLLSEWTEVMF